MLQGRAAAAAGSGSALLVPDARTGNRGDKDAGRPGSCPSWGDDQFFVYEAGLVDSVGEALAEYHREWIGRLLPCLRWHLPVFFNVAQGQKQQLRSGLVAGEVALVLDDLAQAHMQAFDGIGRIDDLSNHRRIHKEWNDLLPLALLHHRHGRELASHDPAANASSAAAAISALATW